MSTRSARSGGPAAALTPGAALGFVGIGRMGLPMSRRLAAAGYDVRAYDGSAEARAAFERATGVPCARALADAAADVDAVVLMLPDSSVVEQVLLGDRLLDRIRAGAVLVDMSSSEPSRTQALATHAGARGIHMVDAPVSGGVAGAEAGTLTVMAGGDGETVEACRPLLDTLAATVLHVGPVGCGHALKALNNLLSATHLLASAEALAIGRRFGLDPEVMLDAINRSSGRSGSTEVKLPRFVLTGTYASEFALSLMLKDMRTAVRLGDELECPTTLAAAAVGAWEEAAAALPETADHTEIARWVERSTLEAGAQT